jgi:hypothetical protein
MRLLVLALAATLLAGCGWQKVSDLPPAGGGPNPCGTRGSATRRTQPWWATSPNTTSAARS